ncbi:hypothetical protein Dimus_036003 [Dionaea muscipula]
MSDDQYWFLDWTLHYSWMRSYLKYLYWYHTVALSPEVGIESLLDPPVMETEWNRRRSTVRELVQFGLSFRLYDMVATFTSFHNILPEGRVGVDQWILGGRPGSMFLTDPDTLEKCW